MNYILLRIRDILSVPPMPMEASLEPDCVESRETRRKVSGGEILRFDCGESRIRECNSICHWGDTPTDIYPQIYDGDEDDGKVGSD